MKRFVLLLLLAALPAMGRVRLGDEPGTTFEEKLDGCNRDLLKTGGVCDAEAYVGNMTAPARIGYGVTLLVDNATIINVRLKSPADCVLRVSDKSGIVGLAAATAIADDNAATLVWRQGSAGFKRMLCAYPDRPGLQVAHLRLNDFSINVESDHRNPDGTWTGPDCSAVVDLMNVTDVLDVNNVVIFGAYNCVGLHVYTDPVHGGGIGPGQIQNVSVGNTGNFANTRASSLLIEAGPGKGVIQALEIHNLTAGHPSPGVPAIRIDGHGTSNVLGVSLHDVYYEPSHPGGTGIVVRDAGGVLLSNISSSMSCRTGDCRQNELVRIEQSHKNANFSLSIRNLIVNGTFACTVNDTTTNKCRTGHVVSYP